MKIIFFFSTLYLCACGIPASNAKNCYNNGVFGGQIDSSSLCEVQMEDESRFLGL